MYLQPWLGGRALTSVGPSRNAVLWARAEDQEYRAPAVSSLKTCRVPFSLVPSLPLSAGFAKRGREEPWTIYVLFFWLRNIDIAFSSKRWVFHSLDASRALTRLTVSSRSRRRHPRGSSWTTEKKVRGAFKRRFLKSTNSAVSGGSPRSYFGAVRLF